MWVPQEIQSEVNIQVPHIVLEEREVRVPEIPIPSNQECAAEKNLEVMGSTATASSTAPEQLQG